MKHTLARILLFAFIANSVFSEPCFVNAAPVRAENEIHLYGHRGYSGSYMQNTLSAFEGAYRAGFDGIEIDVRETDSGDLLIFHDATTDKLCGIPGSIRDVSISNRAHYPLLTKDQSRLLIPTLEETMAFARRTDCTVFFHIKGSFSSEGVSKAIRIIKKYRRQKKTIVFASSYKKLTPFLNHGLRIGITAGGSNPKDVNTRVQWLVDHGGDALIFGGISGISGSSFGKKYVEYCHKKGIIVGVYTAKTAADLQYLIDIDADFAFSNYDLLSKVKTKTVKKEVQIRSVKNRKDGILIQWNRVSGVSGYYVYRKKQGSSRYEKIAAIKKNEVLTYKDCTAREGVQYSYKVRGYFRGSLTRSSSSVKLIR